MVVMMFIGFPNVFGFLQTETLEKRINMTYKEPKTNKKNRTRDPNHWTV